jgi:hypothetical protein
MAKIKVGGSVTKTKPKKAKAKRVTSVSIRENKKIDHSPSWNDADKWTTTEFTRKYHDAMQYYNLEYAGKDLKPAVIKWMELDGYEKEKITQFKKTKDWRCSVVVGGIASCLLKGMPEFRDDFNGGKNTSQWLREKIELIIKAGDLDLLDEDVEVKPVQQPTIQDRMREVAIQMASEIDDIIEGFYADPNAFNPKAFKIINLLKGKEVKAGHARIIQSFYASDLAELEELASGKANDDLREAYNTRSKKQIRALIEFYKEVTDACNMLMQESKVNRKPRIKKPVAKDKLISKLKYKKTDETLKLVSINPADIIDAKELWCFDTKTRKLFRYIADEMTGPLTVKGTSIVGFDESKSIGKTLRKPAEQLKEFKGSSKVALRKFLDTLSTTEVKANGRINENQILLKIL